MSDWLETQAALDDVNNEMESETKLRQGMLVTTLFWPVINDKIAALEQSISDSE